MPNVEKTPRQSIRVDKELWEKAGRAVGTRRRGEVIRDFLRWLTRETDELPERPPAVATDGAGGGQSAASPQDTEKRREEMRPTETHSPSSET